MRRLIQNIYGEPRAADHAPAPALAGQDRPQGARSLWAFCDAHAPTSGPLYTRPLMSRGGARPATGVDPQSHRRALPQSRRGALLPRALAPGPDR